MLEASQVADLYHQLTLDLFDQVVERIKERGTQSLDDNPYLWQAEKLQQMGLLNDENVKMIAERSGIAEEQLRYVLENEGLKIYEDTRQQIMEATGKKGLVTDNSHIQTVLSNYVSQAMFDIDNLINTTLPKSVIGAYQGIVEESVAKVVTGIATHDQAVNQTVMKWFEKGFYGFTDKGGKCWKADNYARTIIKSTAYRVKNEMRMRPAEELGIDTFYYSMKAAAREMCAPLQHQIVTTGNARTEKGIKIYALSDYGYGSPGGCQGINCGHTMTPFIPGVNRIPELNDELKDITPEKAIENANIQSKQRALEREIRHAKEQLHVANQLGDKELIDKYSAKVRSHQSTMRAYIKRNPFLHRDYAREKYYSNNNTPSFKESYKTLDNKLKMEYAQILANLGKRAPKTYEEYKRLDSFEKENLRYDSKSVNYIRNCVKEKLTDKQKEQAIEAYFNFKELGVEFTDHAVAQYIARMRRPNGRIMYNFNSILEVANKQTNYKSDIGGRTAKYYNRLLLIYEKDSNKIVTFMKTNKPAKSLKEIRT
ncbi:phage minor capsid protein [Enterococcus cecorum]|uniref:phage minor capsid protein n=1 Tax=Enterococcus cecorum TaxID=44008 RepID=UPI003D13C5EF